MWAGRQAGDLHILFLVNGFLGAALNFLSQPYLCWEAVGYGVPTHFGLSVQRCLKSKWPWKLSLSADTVQDSKALLLFSSGEIFLHSRGKISPLSYSGEEHGQVTSSSNKLVFPNWKVCLLWYTPVSAQVTSGPHCVTLWFGTLRTSAKYCFGYQLCLWLINSLCLWS